MSVNKNARSNLSFFHIDEHKKNFFSSYLFDLQNNFKAKKGIYIKQIILHVFK